MMDRMALGRASEDLATLEMINRGYSIVARNQRDHGGEIDIVTRRGCELVFVEVRSRRGGQPDDAADSIADRKRAHVRGTAMRYLDARPVDYKEVRFFVITVAWVDDSAKCTVIEDAF